VKSESLAREGVMMMTFDGNLNGTPSIWQRVCALYGWLGRLVVSNVVVFLDVVGTFIVI
jgi:hypothetical protein